MKTYQKVVIAVVVCAIAFAAVQWIRKGKEASLPPAKEPVPVEVIKAKSGSILRRVRAVGDLKAIQSVELHPELEGKIAKIYFADGQSVKAGEPVFKIDDGLSKAKVKEAEAKVMETRANHARAAKLVEKKFGTQAQFDKTLADLKVAEANLEEAKVRLSHTTIKAPFDGVLGLSEVSLGAYVSPQTKLATIVDLDPINVDFNIPESHLPFVHLGDIVDVTIEDFDILPVEAKIIAISPEINPATRTIALRAQFSNEEKSYRPGEFAYVVIIAGEIKNAVLIPEIAIEREGEEEFVWLVIDNIAVKTTVSTGVRNANEVEITHGVKAGDVVISAGQFKVHDGEEVTTVNQS